MVTIVAPKLTYEDLRKMPEDGKRYELIDGEVYMTPSPNTKHQVVVGNLYVALRRFAEETGIGKVFLAPFDVVFGERTAVQPDLLFIRTERLSILTDLNVQGAPDLVIEVLSPSTAAFDRETKLQVYARAGVPELWYVDPKEEIVEILNLSPNRRYKKTARLSGDAPVASQALHGLRLTLEEVFAS
jgi:Uma2 family endonuclease